MHKNKKIRLIYFVYCYEKYNYFFYKLYIFKRFPLIIKVIFFDFYITPVT
jgi:hypothetical protein